MQASLYNNSTLWICDGKQVEATNVFLYWFGSIGSAQLFYSTITASKIVKKVMANDKEIYVFCLNAKRLQFTFDLEY